MFHVDGTPPQSENFASPQAIVGSNFYAQFQRVTRHCIEQGKHLFLAVEATVEHILLGTVYLVGRILEQDILLNRCLKCLSDDCVIMNDRVCRTAVCQNTLVEVLNVLWRHFTQLEFQRREVRQDSGADHVGVALIGCGGQRGAGGLQPLFHVLGEWKQSIGVRVFGKLFCFGLPLKALFLLALVL